MTTDPAAAGALLDLRSYVQCYDEALPAAFCAQMIDSFHQMPQFQTANGRGYHSALDGSAWVELNIQPHVDQAFMGFFYAQIDKYLTAYNARLPMSLPVPARPHLEDLRIKRYRVDAEHQFQPHFDAGDGYPTRYMVFLWYLNDVAKGGETEFVDLGIKVEPRAGRLLMFPPFWMFQHAARKPISNDKYIVSTFMMF